VDDEQPGGGGVVLLAVLIRRQLSSAEGKGAADRGQPQSLGMCQSVTEYLLVKTRVILFEISQ